MNLSKQKTILIVDDDLDISFAIATLLKDEGYVVQVADNGADALEIIEKHGVPNLILLDMMMPKMNGWEFAKAFSSSYDQICPIIAMTASADAIKRANDINAIDLIEKPFEFNKFISVIKKHL